MRRYETILIAHADLSEDEISKLVARYSAIVTGQKGILVKAERWGKRKLAYLIRKQARGFYILLDYAGVSVAVNELERNLKIDDKILKFMTVLKAEAVDPAALEHEIAAAAGKDEKAAPAPAAEQPVAAVEEEPGPAKDEPPPQAASEETDSEAKGDKES